MEPTRRRRTPPNAPPRGDRRKKDAEADFAYIDSLKQTMLYVQGYDTKPERKVKPKAQDKIKAMSPRTWAIAGLAVLAVAIAWFMFAPGDREGSRSLSVSGIARTEVTAKNQSPEATVLPAAKVSATEPAFIETVRLKPSRPTPTRMDSLKAEVVVAPTAPQSLEYIYQWKVNDQIVEDQTGDSLNLSPFKKRDFITVTVTPYSGSTYGHAMESAAVIINSVPPTLDLKIIQPKIKTGEPFELQLVATAPDSERLTFSLESPLVPDMTIDEVSGKISWLLKPEHKGSFHLIAAVKDDNEVKVTKIFEITVN